MNQLTLRGFDDPLRRRIERLAREKDISLNKAALLLLRRGAGLDPDLPPQDVVGDSLDDLVGSWSREEEAELLGSIEPLEQIDESLWR